MAETFADAGGGSSFTEMHHLIAWCGFLGAWLLVAGPIYQAAIELDDVEMERDELVQAAQEVEREPPISRWWLLVPPVAYVLHHRRRDRERRAMIGKLTRFQLEQWMFFSETATAWMFVATGAFLIAVKETWELREAYEWEDWAFWALIAVMVVVCIANTAMRISRRQTIQAMILDGERAP